MGATTGIGSLPHEDVDGASCLLGVPMWSLPTVESSRARDPAFRDTGVFPSDAECTSSGGVTVEQLAVRLCDLMNWTQ